MLSATNAILTLLSAAALSASDSRDFGGKAPLFSKRLSDGSTLALYVKVTEKTVQVRREDAEGRRIGTATEKRPRYQCRVLKVKGKDRELVWETDFTTRLSGVYPEFILKDAELFDGNVYLLYGLPGGFLRVTVLARDPAGRWSTEMEARIEDRPRALQHCRLFQESGRVAIGCRGANLPSGDAREEIWDIRDGAVHKRPRK